MIKIKTHCSVYQCRCGNVRASQCWFPVKLCFKFSPTLDNFSANKILSQTGSSIVNSMMQPVKAIESSEKRGSSLGATHFSQGIIHLPFVQVRHQTIARDCFFQVAHKSTGHCLRAKRESHGVRARFGQFNFSFFLKNGISKYYSTKLFVFIFS